MSNPQQPELARSRKTPHQDQDSVAAQVETRGPLPGEGPGGPVPVENQPGHHPDKEQDKPDLDAFAEKLGITDAGSDNASPRQAASDVVNRVGASSPRRTAAIVAAFLVLVGLLIRGRRRKSRRR